MSELKVRNSNRFGIVPDKVLENKTISLETRAVAAWLCGRQNGFTIRVEAMREHFLGIGEKRWSAIRKELESVGWWRSSKAPTGPRGRFVWSHEFSLDGFADATPVGQDEDLTIPPSGMDAQSRHARGGDNHKKIHQQDVNHHHPKPLQGGGGGEVKDETPKSKVSKSELEDLVNAAYWQATAAGTVRNPTGWRRSLRQRISDNGPDPDDIATIKQWREAKAEAERREKEAAERAEAARLAAEGVDKTRASGASTVALGAALDIVGGKRKKLDHLLGGEAA